MRNVVETRSSNHLLAACCMADRVVKTCRGCCDRSVVVSDLFGLAPYGWRRRNAAAVRPDRPIGAREQVRPVPCSGEPAPVRHRDPHCATFEPLRPGPGRAVPLRRHRAVVPHIGHLRRGRHRLRRPAALARAQRLRRHATSATSPTSTTRSSPRRPSRAGPGGDGRRRTSAPSRDAYDALGCLPPTIEPRATGHIPQMVDMIGGSIDAGHAYAAAGDVYFACAPAGLRRAVRPAARRYGAGRDARRAGKRDPRDFTLWKAAKPGEPSWTDAVGPRPARLAHGVLGHGPQLPRPAFDIHGGGLDLVFPHHENEAAQSKASGDDFARYWMHNAWVTMAGEKMSKSLGNVLSVPGSPSAAGRSCCATTWSAAHYRSIDRVLARRPWTRRRRPSRGSRLPAPRRRSGRAAVERRRAAAAVRRGDGRRPRRAAGARRRARQVRRGNAALAAGDQDGGRARLAAVRAMLGVLGLDPLDAHWAERPTAATTLHGAARRAGRPGSSTSGGRPRPQGLRHRRRHPRPARPAGFAIEDTTDGPRWTLRGCGTGTSRQPASGRRRRRADRPAPTCDRANTEEGEADMAGNCQRRSASARPTRRARRRHRRPARRGLEGRARRRPPPSARATRRPRARPPRPSEAASGRRRRRAGPRRRCRRWSSAATRSSRRCAPASRRRRCTSRRASTSTSGSARRCGWPATADRAAGGPARPSSTG